MKRPTLLALGTACLLCLTPFWSAGAAASVRPSASAPAPASAASASAHPAYREPLCQGRSSLCADTFDNPAGEYVGHDEPSVLFKSGVRGSGNDITYTVELPRDPRTQPTASGATGSTWNFQLRPTFWFGLTLCDTESAPEFTKTCTPDSDRNDLVGTDPTAPDYIGKHPGNAYMELQFYGPGYVPQFEGFGCTATQYCAAMTIDSFNLDQNTGVANTAACDNYLLGGVEPINWAYITRDGHSQAPANPLFTGTFENPDLTAVSPDPAKDLFMNPGDRIRIHMHDTTAGLRIDLDDLTTGQDGSMTASVANGFGHVLYTPTSSTCQAAPYAFHPEYSTANPRGNTWSAHTYNVAMSDEIGHFENCLALDAAFNCTDPGSQDAGGLDEDDGNSFCVPAEDSTLVKINGCFSADEDFDGQSYRNDWPGTFRNVALDRALHPSPVRFTSPVANGRTQYSRVAFETDLPRIEAADSQDSPPFCDRVTGANCVNPPHGAQFYPIFTTAKAHGRCMWQEGGRFIPGTTRTFGGTSTSEYGPLLKTVYPTVGFTTTTRINNFNSGDLRNPCRAGHGDH
ncbi:hypothetical protein ASD62_06700 [Phycicoccus sp. Root563]|uniref:hypothetical protein n=1 Tax=Phycicoccus sp. Root563 TaxID=1736562 RepID=UPI0007035350|nr:hypothetical protein [Phycicoccus sp. Root563]KQZ89040.1 hypothetical protein ASD62_06700 [Phycicoccus sp. Root563]